MRYYISLIALAVIGISIFTACQQNGPNLNASGTAAPNANAAKASAPAAAKPAADPADGAPRITLADAKKEFDAGNAIFVDTRAEVQFKDERVKGSINVPAEAMETRWKEIPTGKKIIAYCS